MFRSVTETLVAAWSGADTPFADLRGASTTDPTQLSGELVVLVRCEVGCALSLSLFRRRGGRPCSHVRGVRR